MALDFLLYGSYGFVGSEIARVALQQGLRPVLAGRDRAKIESQAAELELEGRVFELEDSRALEAALDQVSVALHCAGPYIYTADMMVEACLRTGAHYVDITGEIPVYQAIASQDERARKQGIMLLPGAGFDVAATDCLALHLKQRLPSATMLTLAFYSRGPARLPPGTAKTVIEMIPYGIQVRRDGRLVKPRRLVKTRRIDFGQGPRLATRLTWGDVYMAYHSTGIPNIEDYNVLPTGLRWGLAVMDFIRPLFRLAVVRRIFRGFLKSGSTPEERARTSTHVWGQVEDQEGLQAAARLYGPEAGVAWTARAAVAAVKHVLDGEAPPGFQTPASAYGPDFTLECEGVTREDIR